MQFFLKSTCLTQSNLVSLLPRKIEKQKIHSFIKGLLDALLESGSLVAYFAYVYLSD